MSSIHTIPTDLQKRSLMSPSNTLRLGAMVGASPATYELFEEIRTCANTDYPVLITGESGTGKELVAKTIHDLSRRRSRAFVALNCACLNPALAESELFGHVRGAFTGAERSRRGAFDSAHRGTLFLDEFADLSIAIQASLLRALETHDIRAVGADSRGTTDVRLLCATNANLRDRIRDGRFRADLLFRVNVLQIRVPALRERLSDIDVLAKHLLRNMPSQNAIDHEAIGALKLHDWPGNVRELRNVLTRSAVKAGHRQCIRSHHVSLVLEQTSSSSANPPIDASFQRRQYDAVSRCLRENRGNRKATYQALGIPRSTFYRWLREGKVHES